MSGPPGESLSAAPVEPRRDSDAFTPHECPEPSPEWRAYAAKLVDEAAAAVGKQRQALDWLAARGLPADAVRKYRIGYLSAEGAKYPGRWRARVALGLPPKVDDSGRQHDKIFIPRGIVIPTIATDGAILNIRIRRHKQDLKPLPSGKPAPKYMELEGSCKAPMLLRAGSPPGLAAYFVTEAELDAILIHFAAGGVVGALAVRTNRGKPDRRAHGLLLRSVKICVALDYDEPGASGVPWWEGTYPQAVRWPTPEGKDPGDAFSLGVDIREWAASALPATIHLPPSAPVGREHGADSREASLSHAEINSDTDFGRLDMLPAGLNAVGGKGAKEGRPPEKKEGDNGMRTSADVAAESDVAGFTDEEARILRAAMTREFAAAPLSFFPVAVLRAWLLWRGIPISFKKRRDAAGNCTGFGWEYDYAWRAKNRERFEAFFEYQDKCQTLWTWMSDHPDMTIDWKNLLHFWR